MEREKILVLKRSHMLHTLGDFQGFRTTTPFEIQSLLVSSQLLFIDREDAEKDPTYKQIIPYCILTHKNKVLKYTRGQTGGEQRLKKKTSIGIGGHINPIDSENSTAQTDFYENGLARELREEILFSSILKRKTLGFLNDDSNPVGEVHLGIIELLEVENETVTPLEESIHNPQFLEIEEVAACPFLENWSKIAMVSLSSGLCSL